MSEESITLSQLLCASPQRVTVAGTARLQNEAARLCDELESMTRERDTLRAELAEARRERDEFCAIVADRTEEISSLEFQLTQATAAAAVPDDVAKDAARYRWLRDGDNGGVLSVGALTGVSDMGWERVTWIYDEALDAAIDAAILSAKEKGQ